MNLLRLIPVGAALAHASVADAASLMLTMNAIDAGGVGRSIGTVEMRDTRYGLFIAPKLSDLPPGLHGFHVHENPACGPTAPNGQTGAGLAAGGHYDPAKRRASIWVPMTRTVTSETYPCSSSIQTARPPCRCSPRA